MGQDPDRERRLWVCLDRVGAEGGGSPQIGKGASIIQEVMLDRAIQKMKVPQGIAPQT